MKTIRQTWRGCCRKAILPSRSRCRSEPEYGPRTGMSEFPACHFVIEAANEDLREDQSPIAARPRRPRRHRTGSSGCRLPSPAWKHVCDRQPRSRDECGDASRTSARLRRGIVVHAEVVRARSGRRGNADLRPDHMRRRSRRRRRPARRVAPQARRQRLRGAQLRLDVVREAVELAEQQGSAASG